jgi:hypothetical protein
MLETLSQDHLIEINDFNKQVLKKLQPYFDLDVINGTKDDHFRFYENLLVLAKHSLGVAHCVQHHHSARSLMQGRFLGKYPDWYDHVYGNMIGCFSSHKKADAIMLDGRTVSGVKHWISNVHLADFGFFRAKTNDPLRDADVLIDFKTVKPIITLDYSVSLGMEIARAGSITLDNYELPENCIFILPGDAQYLFTRYKSGVNFGFITNYLGLIMGLYKDFEDYIIENNINVNFEHRKMGLAISSLTMHWRNNLSTIMEHDAADTLWHKHNTQYTISKNVLLDLIHLVLQVCDSRWVDAHSSRSQRLRDALTYCAHMRPLQNNVTEHVFLRF